MTKHFWGSVKFFKQLMFFAMLVVLPLSLIAVVTLSITFFKVTRELRAEIGDLKSKLNQTESESDAQDWLSSQSAVTSNDTNDNGSSDNVRDGSSDNGSSDGSIKDDVPQSASELIYPAIHFSTAPRLIAPLNGQMGKPSLASTVQVTTVPLKIAYLTFDDGPTPRTVEILDILDDYHALATFFVTNQSLERHPEICEEAYSRGHAIGMHSATHRYQLIYASQASFLLDLEQNYLKILEVTGMPPSALRFPGGSVNSYNKPVAATLIDAVLNRGFSYFDWNCSAGDALSQTSTPEQMVKNVTATMKNKDPLVILLHDSQGKTDTVKALPLILDLLQEQGYVFGALNSETPPIRFKNIPSADIADDA